jgi:hypothetical protein
MITRSLLRGGATEIRVGTGIFGARIKNKPPSSVESPRFFAEGGFFGGRRMASCIRSFWTLSPSRKTREADEERRDDGYYGTTADDRGGNVVNFNNGGGRAPAGFRTAEANAQQVRPARTCRFPSA